MGENQIHPAEKVKLKPLLSICEISTVRFHSKNIHLILTQLCICLTASFVHATAAWVLNCLEIRT